MNRSDFKKISRQRVREAAALLRLGHHQGAYYLAGYAVECALKACIAKRTERFDFPDKRVATDAWKHELNTLLRTAGLAGELATDIAQNQSLERNWTLVKDWSEEVRYRVEIAERDAKQFLDACNDRASGVLPWIRRRW